MWEEVYTFGASAQANATPSLEALVQEGMNMNDNTCMIYVEIAFHLTPRYQVSFLKLPHF